jgi:hypothetical protein
LRKPKKEATPVTSPDAEDDTILEAVMAPSLNNVIPIDLLMPMDAALAWSKAEGEREEAERKQRLLEEAAPKPSDAMMASSSSMIAGMTGEHRRLLLVAPATLARVVAAMLLLDA